MTPQERETLFYGEQSDPVIVDELVGLLKRIVMVTCDGPEEMPWRVVSSGSHAKAEAIRALIAVGKLLPLDDDGERDVTALVL